MLSDCPQFYEMSKSLETVFACLFVLFSVCNAVNIKCTLRVDHWSPVGTDYGCFDAIIIDASNPLHVSNITGSHQIGFDSSHVRIFSLANDDKVTQLPRGIERYFPNLIGLRWEDSNLTKITVDNLRYFPNLSVLSFWNNKLEKLESNLFSETKRLTYIHFSSNPITEVGDGIFDKLEDLTQAYFQNTKCVSSYANHKGDLKALKEVIEEKC